MNFLYINNLTTVKNSLKNYDNNVKMVFNNYEKKVIDKNSILFYDETNSNKCLYEDKNKIGYVLGYIRFLGTKSKKNIRHHNLYCGAEISKKHWPLSNNFTGSFSILNHDKKTKTVSIANDVLGIYPIYYSIFNNSIYISSSLILLASITKQDIDYVGISEKLVSGLFTTFGKRTTVKNIYRLLPGEAIYFNFKNKIYIEKKYDNTLYQNIARKPIKQIAKQLNKIIKEEIDICLYNDKNVILALSGGIDSRVVLGNIKDKNLRCVTYGNDSDYETKIAKKLADICGANFKSYRIDKYHFPKKQLLKKYIIETESLGIQAWLGIFENFENSNITIPFLIGDVSDCLTGRHLYGIESKKEKVYKFLRYHLFGKEIPFTKNSTELYDNWKKIKTDYYLDKIKKIDFGFIKSNEEVILKGIKSDLNEMFKRIEGHNIMYYEQLHEIFSLYTRGRIFLSKQLLLGKNKCLPLAPIMSQTILRYAFSVHPAQKILFKLIDELFKQNNYAELSKIPLADTPFIPAKSNNRLRLLIWGIRSKIDEKLIQRQMKYKNPNKRNRVLKSINWIKPYREKVAERNIQEYFKNNHLELKDYSIKIFKNRSKMVDWPLTPTDIISLSAMNLEAEIIESIKNES